MIRHCGRYPSFLPVHYTPSLFFSLHSCSSPPLFSPFSTSPSFFSPHHSGVERFFEIRRMWSCEEWWIRLYYEGCFLFLFRFDRWLGTNRVRILWTHNTGTTFSTDAAVHTNILFLKKQILLNRQQDGGNNGGLKPSDRKVLSHIISFPDDTASKIAEGCGIGKRTVERSLSFLQGKGMIERIGSKRDGRWIVIKWLVWKIWTFTSTWGVK